MKTRLLGVVLIVAALLASAAGGGEAQNSDEVGPAAEATISVLQTRVAELEGTLEPTSENGDLVGGTSPATSGNVLEASNISSIVDQNRPVQLAEGLDLLYYHAMDDPYGGVLIAGEVQNTSSLPIDGPSLQFAFYDDDGNILASGWTGTIFVVIEPGEKMPFELSVYDLEMGGWSTEDVNLCSWGDNYYVSDPSYGPEGLEITEVEEIVKEPGNLELLGQS